MPQKLFEFAALHHPKPTKDQRDAGIDPQSAIVVKPDVILAKDEKVAAMQAARKIPEEYADRLDQVEILVRPF